MRLPRPDTAARDALLDRATAADLALRAALRAPAEGEAPREPARPSYGDIHRAALGNAAARALVTGAAARDGWVARAYAEALSRAAVAVFGAVHAASTGGPFARSAGGYRLEIRLSQRRPDRCFLLVECPPGAPVPRALSLPPEPGKDPVPDLALPEAADGTIQLILPSDHPTLAALQDPDRSVILT